MFLPVVSYRHQIRKEVAKHGYEDAASAALEDARTGFAGRTPTRRLRREKITGGLEFETERDVGGRVEGEGHSEEEQRGDSTADSIDSRYLCEVRGRGGGGQERN